MNVGNPKYNSSGCKDLTAYNAIKNATKEELDGDKKANDLIRAIKALARGFDFETINRIAIKDIKTGKEYR